MNRAFCALVLLGALGCAPATGESQQVPVVGLPCEGCEAVFDGIPETVPESARIAPAGEPGEPMVLEGIVRDGSGAPRAGIVVYAYHTDANGIFSELQGFLILPWRTSGCQASCASESISV